jgi:hypothetical protein
MEQWSIYNASRRSKLRKIAPKKLKALLQQDAEKLSRSPSTKLRTERRGFDVMDDFSVHALEAFRGFLQHLVVVQSVHIRASD